MAAYAKIGRKYTHMRPFFNRICGRLLVAYATVFAYAFVFRIIVTRFAYAFSTLEADLSFKVKWLLKIPKASRHFELDLKCDVFLNKYV